MQGMVAFCENPSCGSVFEHAGIIGGSGNVTINMTNTRIGPCPNCGGVGLVPDGVYEYANHFIEFIKGPIKSVMLLKQLEELFMGARESNQSKEEILQEIDNSIPEASEFINNIPDIATFNQWITLVISILTFAILLHATYSDNDDDKYKDMFLEHLLQENKRLQQPKEPIRRNSQCICGSGQRYKHCCGVI
jgi:hypothetical protein